MDLHLIPTAFFAGCGPKEKNRNGRVIRMNLIEF